MVVAISTLAGCTTNAGVPPPTPQPSQLFPADESYSLGETISYDSGVLVTVRHAGTGKATPTAVGASPDENLEAFNVYVENHTDSALDLSPSSLRLQYTLDENSFEAPAVADVDSSEFGSATGTLPSPVPPGKSSNAAWLFAVPENHDGAVIELALNRDFRPIYFEF